MVLECICVGVQKILKTSFPKMFINSLQSHPQSYFALHLPQHFVLLIFNCSHSRGCVVVFHSDFIFHFPDSTGDCAFLLYLLARFCKYFVCI